MTRTDWLRFERWYNNLHRIQQWLVKIGLAVFVLLCIMLVTHEPSERKRQARIILNCDNCGTDPERAMDYNTYMDQKERLQKAWFFEDKKRIQQEIWDENGRRRWCRAHPNDKNCKENK
jgi:hypothetical protein